MENIFATISKQTRKVYLSKSVIGNDGENLQEKFIFSFNDEFVNGTARLEIKKPNKEKTYIMLTKVNNTYELPVKSVITKAGRLDMQLVITEGINDEEIPIFKSNTFFVIVNNSINAETIQEEDYPDFIDRAEAKLNAMDNLDIDATETLTGATITITKKDGTQESVDISNGTNGQDGADGFSPIASVSQGTGSATISIMDKNGTTTATVHDGERGSDGQDGANGITPTIGNNGNWYLGTTDTGKPSRGIQGETGQTGANGQDGVSPTVSTSKSGTVTTITITDKDGEHTATINDGQDGQNGTDGTSPTASVSKSNGVATITITDKNGTTTATVSDGTNGTNGTDGRDGYVQYTAGDNITIENNVISATGGSAGLNIGYLRNSVTSNNAFVFSGKEPGVYVLSIDLTSNQTSFWYKATSSGTAYSVSNTIPLLMFIGKKYDDVTPTAGGVDFAYLYYFSKGNTNTSGSIGCCIFYLTTSGITTIPVSPNGTIITGEQQTYSGKKLFNTYPEIKTYAAPTTNNQFAPKKYVDDQITTAVGNINTVLATLTTPSNNS